MRSATVPIIRYLDAKAAMSWLCDAFGFEVFLNVPGVDERIEHARLILGENMVMLASLGRDGDFESRFKPPSSIMGVTQCTSLFVENPDEVYEKAVLMGAKIIDDIADFQFNGRTFSCEDIENHPWVITSHDPWEKSW